MKISFKRRIAGLLLMGLVASLVAIAAVATASTAIASSAECRGNINEDIGAAKASYSSNCGITYSDSSGFHKCDWVTGGWQCEGPQGTTSSGSASAQPEQSQPSAPAPTPTIIEVGDLGRYVNVVWNSNSNLKGVNVYRNGRYVASVNMPSNVYNDYSGNHGDVYTLVGYDHDDQFSAESEEASSVSLVASGTYIRWSPGVTNLDWDNAPGATVYKVYRDGQFFAWSRNSEFLDRNSPGRHSYTVRAVDRNGNVGPESSEFGMLRLANVVNETNVTPRSSIVQTGQTGTFTMELAPNRTFSGSMTVDADSGISFSGTVSDNQGNELGTYEQSYDGSNMVGEVDSYYDGSGAFDMKFQGDPMELAAGIGGPEALGNLYASRPPTARPSDTGGENINRDDEEDDGGIDFDDLDDRGTTDPAGSPNCGSNGCP